MRNPVSVRKGLAAIGEAFATEMSGADRSESWLTLVDPRAKIIGVIVMIFASTLLQTLPSLGVLLCLALILTASGKLGFKRLFKLWLGVPLFSAAIILPAAFNIVTPGEPVFTLWRFGENAGLGQWVFPNDLTITIPGVIAASRFMVRVVICITLIAVVTSTTESSALVNALRQLGLPKVFGMTLAMMQRYLSTMLFTAQKIHLAKISRTMGPMPMRAEQRWVAAGIGILFGRTYHMAERVRLAMLSRGYDGDLQARRVSSIRIYDYMWISGVFLTMIGVLLMDYHIQ